MRAILKFLKKKFRKWNTHIEIWVTVASLNKKLLIMQVELNVTNICSQAEWECNLLPVIFQSWTLYILLLASYTHQRCFPPRLVYMPVFNSQWAKYMYWWSLYISGHNIVSHRGGKTFLLNQIEWKHLMCLNS